MSLLDFCKIKDFEQIIFASETEDESNKIININKIKERIAILIGPEGGFSQTEYEDAEVAGFTAVSLGPRILRTETAAAAALAVMQAAWGDLG